MDINSPRVIQKYTKFTYFARLYFRYFAITNKFCSFAKYWLLLQDVVKYMYLPSSRFLKISSKG